MQDADKGITGVSKGDLSGEGLRIAVVRARFNDAVTTAVEQACVDELLALKVDPRDITRVSVPGALEVPLALKALADAGDHDALVAVGCVIRGETYHFELVANESAAGVMRVALDHRIAIANAILTVDTQAQAQARAKEKGIDAARVAIEMANVLEDLS